MHKIIVSKHLQEPALEPGAYFASDSTTAEILAMRDCRVLGFDYPLTPFDPTHDWNGQTILIVRQGAIGDILFLTPAIREIKKRWPDAMVDVACFDRFKPVLANNPDVHSVITNPVESKAMSNYACVVWLDDDLAEETVEAKTVHAVDLVLNRLQLATDDKELRYEVTLPEKAAAWSRLPRFSNRKRIGIQLSASTPTRTWPRTHVHHFAVLAIKAGYEVVFFGMPGETGTGKTPPPMFLEDLTRLDPPLSLRESAAIMTTCDSFVGVDSALTHIAGALKIPTVALFGAFPSRLRTAYAKSIKAIDGDPIRHSHDKRPCSPCFHHIRVGQRQFPEDGPCHHTGQCEVLAGIDPQRVLTKLERLMRKADLVNNSGQ